MTQDGGDAATPLTNRPVICVSHGFQTNYERGFCNGLAARGVRVTLIASDRTDFAGLHAGVHALNLRGSQAVNRPKLAKLVNMLRYHVSLMGYAVPRHRAVVHVMGLMWPVFLCGVVQGLWFRLVCWRYVLTVHDVLPEVEDRERYRRLCRWSYRLAHHLVVHTQRMKDVLVRDFDVTADRVTVMEHGIEPLPEISSLPDERCTADEPVLLVAFGAVTTRKGTDLLLQALAQVDFRFRLVIAGICVDQAFRERLQGLIAAHPRADCIDWRDGFIEEGQANALLQSADAMVLSYRHIDQSGVLFQALRFGVPVVATRVGQFERYVSDEVGELAPPADIDGLRQALQRWHARRHALSHSRIREIGRAFEWKATVGALASVYGASAAQPAALQLGPK
jgi:glycosyltransferase involved in cell wall biosynthesis